jgi:hypothetical protein
LRANRTFVAVAAACVAVLVGVAWALAGSDDYRDDLESADVAPTASSSSTLEPAPTSTSTTTLAPTTSAPSTTVTTTEAPTTTAAPPTAPPTTAAAAPPTAPPTTAPAPVTTAPPPPAPPTTLAPPGVALNCVVWLHGKGGTGQSSFVNGRGVKEVVPQGNHPNPGGGYYWEYFPEGSYQVVRSIVASAITTNGCTRVVIDGFSNGGAAAGKLYCRGETFGGTVVGYVVDDPVVDHGADGCARPAGVRIRLYWTGALDGAYLHSSCSAGGWICDGDETIGVDAYAANLGSPWVKSPNSCHCGLDAPPEFAAWLN